MIVHDPDVLIHDDLMFMPIAVDGDVDSAPILVNIIV